MNFGHITVLAEGLACRNVFYQLPNGRVTYIHKLAHLVLATRISISLGSYIETKQTDFRQSRS